MTSSRSQHKCIHRRRCVSVHDILTAALVVLMACCATVAAGDPTAAQECVVDNDGQCRNKDDSSSSASTEDLVRAAAGATVNAKDATADNGNEEEDDHEEEELDPVWYEGTANEIGTHIKCPWDTDPDEHASLTTMYTEESWKLFNEIYHKVVPREPSSLPSEFTQNGYHVPIEIKLGDLGRGVFATEDISKDTLIWKSTNTAEFHTGQEYRDFLRLLPQPLACDVLMWAYIRIISDEDDNKMMVCADLDEGSFVNHGRTEANMELGINGRGLLQEDEHEELTWYGCDLEFYANRDIKAGEEIRANYNNFIEVHGWRTLGL